MVFGRSSAPQPRPASGSKSPPAATLKRKDTLSTLMANEPDDLSQLLSLDEDSVHDALRSRYEKRKIYTYINNLLVALNPYQLLPIYGEELLKAYTEYGSAPPGPHVYGVGAATYRGLLEARSQSIIISGESGAGKTETAKRFLQYLAYAATRGASSSSHGLEERVLATSPLLEAFGNAQTVLNHNSSRYGKFLMLQFDLSGRIMGGTIQTYLLEKVRIVQQQPGERGYHVLYYLAAAAPAPLRAELQLGAITSYHYLGAAKAVAAKGAEQDERAMFASTEAAMSAVGFGPTEMRWVWALLGAVLGLGNVAFKEEGDATAIADHKALALVGDTLRCDARAMGSALTTRRIKAGGEWITTPVKLADALGLRDGFAKAIYSKTFAWIVRTINTHLYTGEEADMANDIFIANKARFFVGILDIFGFEIFEVNSLEQLCINFTNEKLQATFNQAVFQAAMEENAEEGVSVEVADMSEIDNTETIELLEARPNGILGLINEECVVPQGSDATLVDKMFQQLMGNKRLKRPLKRKSCFQVMHFAGVVTYSSEGLLEKNKDPISEDLLTLLRGSDEGAVRKLFDDEQDAQLMARKKGAKFQGVVAKFQLQLAELLAVVESSETHFVRCIKPNMHKSAASWEAETVTKQLRCAGVMEAVRVIAAGYPDRVPHTEVVARFGSLVTGQERPAAELMGEKAAAVRTLQLLGLKEGEYLPGHSKMFLKAGVLGELRTLRERKIHEGARGMQAAIRGMIARKLFRAMWEAELERRRREEEERRRREEEERQRREEEERQRKEAEELSKLEESERLRILDEERRRKAAEERELREEAARRRHEEETHRLAQEVLEREREEEEASPVREAPPALGQSSLGPGSSSTGFRLDMNKISGAAAKAADEPDMLKWTPRARPKDAPKQSARYQSQFKSLSEDVLEYAVYLGMEPKEDADLLWIAEEALTANEPEGWEEQMDPNGNLYYRSTVTGQSSRQHPLDEYYQNLYLKLKMQRMMEVAGMGVPEDLRGKDMSSLTSEDLRRMRSHLAAKMEGEASVQRQSAPREVSAATTSISEALTLTTPRSTKAMTDKFGISQPDTDVRALLINPARWAEKSTFIDTVVEKDASNNLLPRYHMHMVLNDAYKAFAFSASKRVLSHNTHFAISLDSTDADNSSSAFCGKLRCNAKGTEFSIYDDSNDPYGLKTGKPRRELGVITFRRKLIGPITLEVVIPRVRKDGACAQFRPSQPEESMVQLYKAGRVEHMFVLKGTANVAPGGVVELWLNTSGARAGGQSVFQAFKAPEGHWSVKYAHPLSCFQAFNIAVAIFHNPATAGLDALPAKDASEASQGGKAAAGDGKPPPLAGKPKAALGKAAPGSIVNTASLEGLSHAVYAMVVQGAKVYSGLYNGNIQVWHMDAYVNLPSGSRPEYHTLTGHTSCIYCLLVTDRQLISAAHDKLIKVWDLNTMRCRHTLKGHASRVRALALSGSLLFSGSNDKSIKVWNLDSYSNTTTLESHSSWIRALATDKDVLASASKDVTVKVWDLKLMKLIFTFNAGSEVYCLAMASNTVYGGCQDCKIRVWNLNTMQKSYMLIGHEGVVRCLHVHSTTLFSGGSDCKVKLWDLKTNDCTTLFGHTSFVRAVACDQAGQTLYSGADDRKIKIWQAR